MSDLDLDVIRAWWWNFDASVDAGIRGLEPGLATTAVRDIRALLAEVERLRANQLPDGGEWQTHGGWIVDGHFQRWISGTFASQTHQRRVWTGPVEPIALKSTESAATGADVESPTDG